MPDIDDLLSFIFIVSVLLGGLILLTTTLVLGFPDLSTTTTILEYILDFLEFQTSINDIPILPYSGLSSLISFGISIITGFTIKHRKRNRKRLRRNISGN